MAIFRRSNNPNESDAQRKERIKAQLKEVLQMQIYLFYLIFYHIQEFIRETLLKLFCKKEQKPGQIQVKRILFKHKMDHEEISRREDFVTTCGQNVEIEVLNNPNWHLYCVERDRAFFVLLPRHISYYSLERFPFMYVPIFEEALAVAEVPKEEFLTLAKKFNERNIPKTVLFTNTARCGSTLLGRMLNRPGDSICFGEPYALAGLSIGLEEGYFTEREAKELLGATISCLRAHTPEGQVCVLKTTSSEAKLVHLTKDIKNFKNIFMFRKKGLPSVEKVVARESFKVKILLNVYNYSPIVARFISLLNPAMEGTFVRKLKPESLRAWSALVYAAPYSHYLKNQELYCHPTVWYHELLQETSKTLAQLFEAIDIPLKCVEAAVECKKEDSQRNSFLSWESLSHVEIPPVTDEDRDLLRQYAKVLEVPADTFDC